MPLRSLFFLLLFAPFCLAFAQSGHQPQALHWDFPLTRVHTGMLLGNGTQGLMVWGEGNELRVTVGRAGFWDHRGGNDFSTRITYPELKRLLETGDEAGLRAAFAVPEKEGAPDFGRPQQLGGGRLTLTLPAGWTLEQGRLSLATGEIVVRVKNGSRQDSLRIRQHPEQELALLALPTSLSESELDLIPAHQFVQATYEKVGIPAPHRWEEGESFQVVTQSLPDDLPLALGFRKVGQNVLLASELAENAEKAVWQNLQAADAAALRQVAASWWQAYWQDVPFAQLPDLMLQETYDYGLYKQACATPPQGLACTLQGPFMEDYQMVPWSNDYHFNINIEMIYYPALMSGRFAHFEPLWEMVNSWQEEISHNGEAFFGQEGALMLPHAVDDRAKVVGTFWTGTIDHACTAWMAQLAWLHHDYSGDEAVLRETAWPLLIGAFEGFWAMLEEKEGKMSLPVSVSPEYRGSAMNAWGKDASFQLAALHAICEILPQAAAQLGEPADPRWAEVSEKLPPYTTFTGVYQEEWQRSNTRIALWEGMDLVESHRHHSHLGGIWPFVTYDPLSEDYAEVVGNSLATWRYRGMGGWSGWCVPWAAILMARTDQSEAAVNYLRYWRDNFVNEGRGTLHNANTLGHSVIGAPVWPKLPPAETKEVMQLDAGFGALTAVYELLLQQRRDGLHVFPGLSIYWKEAAFREVHAPGGFLVSAKVEQGEVVAVEVTATRAGELLLHHGLGETYTVNGEAKTGSVLREQVQASQKFLLERR